MDELRVCLRGGQQQPDDREDEEDEERKQHQPGERLAGGP